MPSKCCGATTITSQGVEGTSCWICTKCNQPTDEVSSYAPREYFEETRRCCKNARLHTLQEVSKYLEGTLDSAWGDFKDRVLNEIEGLK